LHKPMEEIAPRRHIDRKHDQPAAQIGRPNLSAGKAHKKRAQVRTVNENGMKPFQTKPFAIECARPRTVFRKDGPFLP